MYTYHKIQTVFLRDPETNHKTLLHGQYAWPEFEYLQNDKWVFTEKVDGTNIRITYRKQNGIRFSGKTDRAQIPSFLCDALHDLFKFAKFNEVFDSDICLYGEGYGPKIQKGGGNYRRTPSFVLFDVLISGLWLQRKDVEDVAAKLGIDVVPVIGVGTLPEMVSIVNQGTTSVWGDFTAEGIVARPKIELQTRAGERIITKIKHRDFRK